MLKKLSFWYNGGSVVLSKSERTRLMLEHKDQCLAHLAILEAEFLRDRQDMMDAEARLIAATRGQKAGTQFLRIQQP